MQTHVKNPLTGKVYRLQDVLNTCTGNSLNLILFKNIELDSSTIYKSKVIVSDIRYPIVVMPKGDGKYLIIDGNHRYTRMKSKDVKACVAFVVKQKHFDKIKTLGDTYPEVRTTYSNTSSYPEVVNLFNGQECSGCAE